jgi:ribonuclease HII
MADFKIERDIRNKGGKTIAGVDEVGRGALFGPVLAAAVVLPESLIIGPAPSWLEDVNDSKTLTPRKRKELAKLILAEAEAVGVGMASHAEIDEKNIYWASLEAMTRAVRNLPLAPGYLLIDGPRLRLRAFDIPQVSIPRGDRTSKSIAAASIVAKVLRDEMMMIFDDIYKGYRLCKNKGYGTREHYRALKEMGPTTFHRLTFNLRSEAGRP